MDEQPRLNVVAADPPPDRPRRRRRAGRGHHSAAILGAAVGIAAIVAIALLLVRSGDGSEAASPATAPAATTALPELKIVFPEGFTRRAMADRIGAVNAIAAEERGLATALRPKRYLALTSRSELPGTFAGDGEARSLEGFLFPATYAFTPETTTAELVELQLDAFERTWARVDLTRAERRNLTPYDVLIIASMIEGEVVVPKERAVVAAVIYNRLRAGIPLGIDATLRYGLDIPPTEAITQSQLESDNPYNTRNRAGLPPTPIGNPGLAAMQAAAHPAEADFLYFARTKDCKSHFFARTEVEFLEFLNGPDSFLAGPKDCG